MLANVRHEMHRIEASGYHSSMQDRLCPSDRDPLKISDLSAGRMSPVEWALRLMPKA